MAAEALKYEYSTIPPTWQNKPTKTTSYKKTRKPSSTTRSSETSRGGSPSKAKKKKAINLWGNYRGPTKKAESPKTQIDDSTGEELLSAVGKTQVLNQNTQRKGDNTFYGDGDPYADSTNKKTGKIKVDVIADSGSRKPENPNLFYAIPENDEHGVKLSETATMEIPIPQREKKGLWGSVKEKFGASRPKAKTVKPGRIYKNRKDKDTIYRAAVQQGIDPADLTVLPGHDNINLSDKKLEAEIKKLSKAEKKPEQKKIEIKKKPKVEVKKKPKKEKPALTLKSMVPLIARKVQRLSKTVTPQAIKEHQKVLIDTKAKVDKSLGKATRKLIGEFQPGGSRELSETEFKSFLSRRGLVREVENYRRLNMNPVQIELEKQLKIISRNRVMRSSLASKHALSKIVKDYNKNAPEGYKIKDWSVSPEGTAGEKYYVPYISFENVPPREIIAIELDNAYNAYQAQSKAEAKGTKKKSTEQKAKTQKAKPKTRNSGISRNKNRSNLINASTDTLRMARTRR